MRSDKETKMASHIAQIEGFVNQLAAMKMIIKEALKVVLLLVTLSGHKNYAAFVTSLKMIGTQEVT